MSRPRSLEKDPNPERHIRIADNPNYKEYKNTGYYVGIMGDIYHVFKTVDSKITPYTKVIGRCTKYIISYTTDRTKERPRGRRTNKPVKNIVWETYRGEIPEGYIVYNKNGLRADNALNNLGIMKREDYGRKHGPRTERTRYVLDLETNKIYIGTRSAGKATGYSGQAISDICNGVTKSGRFKYLKKRPYEKDKE